MKEAIASWEPQARALLRFMAMYMILLHGLREVFGIVPAKAKGPGSFMPLDPLGHVGGVLLLVLGVLFLVGLFTRASPYCSRFSVCSRMFMPLRLAEHGPSAMAASILSRTHSFSCTSRGPVPVRGVWTH
jgi:hypothetical protein